MWRRPSASKPGFNGAIAMPAFYGDSYRDECADPARGDGGASAEWREDSFTGKQTERDGSETSDLSLDVPNESDIIKQGNLRKRSAAAPRVWQVGASVLGHWRVCGKGVVKESCRRNTRGAASFAGRETGADHTYMLRRQALTRAQSRPVHAARG
eukprot:6191047-Pleurochrysis_carterae.AAC.1